MAEDLLDTIGQLFGPIRGGLAFAAVLVGALLAATTGVVAASVIAGDFSLVDRAANAIGISVERVVLTASEDFRAAYGINDFPSAANTLG